MLEVSCLLTSSSAHAHAHCTPLFTQHSKTLELDQEKLAFFYPQTSSRGSLDLPLDIYYQETKVWTDACWIQEELRPRQSLPYQVSSAKLDDGECTFRTSGQNAQDSNRVFQEEAEKEEDQNFPFSSITHPNSDDDLTDDTIVVAALSACIKRNDIHTGHKVHAEIVRKSLLETNVFVGNSLVNLYAKFGVLSRAHKVFEEVYNRNVVTWNGLISGYAQHDHGYMAFHCLEQMQLDGISPSRATFLSILKACIGLRTAEKGQEVHAMIVKEGSLEKNVSVANALIDMYAKCGMLERAEKIFDTLLVRNVVTWNSLINSYAQHELGEEALSNFKMMLDQGILPDDITFVSVLSACGCIGASSAGEKIHTQVAARGSLESNIAVVTALIDMYAKSGMLVRAQEVFDKLATRAVVSWNALIAGYIQQEHFDKAFICYSQMQLNGILPDRVTFLCILKACGSVRAGDRGLEIHDDIARVGLCNNTEVSNGLIDMYGKCGLIEKAQEVFDNLMSRNVVSWNAMIAGFAQEAHYEKALNLLDKMQLDGFSPDVVTLVCILKVYGSMEDAKKGQDIHATICKLGLLEEETVVSNALMNLYATCSMLAETQNVFEKLSKRNVVSWNTLITGFAEHELDEEALKFLEYMQVDGFSPNAITFSSTLKACGNIGFACKGQGIHDQMVKLGLESDVAVGTAAVDMYANCGMLKEAQQVFNKILTQDVVLWNVLIAGQAQMGQAEICFDLLKLMIKEGESPDISTFTSMLNVCNHTGVIYKGQKVLELMTKYYGIYPDSDLCNCTVDLFARAGQLEEAIGMIEEIPFFAGLRVWHIVLGASQKCGNIKLGRVAFTLAAKLNEVDPAAYVSISNILAAADREEDICSETEDGSMKVANA